MNAKKEDLADRLAKRALQGGAFQRSWQTHVQMFGPILDPAFADDPRSRVHLISALNHISSRDTGPGFEKLKKIYPQCSCDADKAAVLFFMGLCFDIAGAKEDMLSFYHEAELYGHRFYLPYLKMAKTAHIDGAFDFAEEKYRQAIDCLEGNAPALQSGLIIASVHSNLAACLTMMHRFEEAEAEFALSAEIYPELPERCAAMAVLYAAVGDKQRMEQMFSLLSPEHGELLEAVQAECRKIMEGKNPQFSPVDPDAAAIAEFWAWFSRNSRALLAAIYEGRNDDFLENMSLALALLLPFAEREPELGFGREDGRIHIILNAFYMTAARTVYEQLLSAMPPELDRDWLFGIIH